MLRGEVLHRAIEVVRGCDRLVHELVAEHALADFEAAVVSRLIHVVLRCLEAGQLFGQNGFASASSGGNTVTGTPACHCTMVMPAPTRRPFSSNLISPSG